MCCIFFIELKEVYVEYSVILNFIFLFKKCNFLN
jgi:hypothetical protein